ncbi:MAG: FAD-binding oxidoreductase, partial [Sandaracinaceae bacterium]|nr:FAD-binding oxidoreductase [Sandaracinaceae bacterium]
MRTGRRRSIVSWGRDRAEAFELRSERLEEASARAALSRGLGRSYGDASLPHSELALLLSTERADRILSFNEESGIVRAEAGLSLAELHRIFIPRGYFSPVTPGTQFVTLGGMVAADVHGKNQHRAGNFGDHLRAIRLRVAGGRVLEVSASSHPELFRATIGGMGLTGHILEVEFALDRIPSRYIYQEALRIPNLETFEEELRSSAARFPFTMGWIDALSRGRQLGRGVLYRGRFAEREELSKRLPRAPRPARLAMDFPSWVLNPWSIRAFNELKYRSQLRRLDSRIVTLEEFFIPSTRFMNGIVCTAAEASLNINACSRV